ncbi:hypothetical protein BJ508DRAFT_313138 [Ascobolus immersus RN42]|uniref:Uncharacterized protein n=1 Tax=Ascobolus immersus RN42 TaxID=1160509 RepID=A0A3N4HJW8_ASCIM|nr:hypothetical protein BJ508DRAFT_313138 [Ascobolus immersus RN42]
MAPETSTAHSLMMQGVSRETSQVRNQTIANHTKQAVRTAHKASLKYSLPKGRIAIADMVGFEHVYNAQWKAANFGRGTFETVSVEFTASYESITTASGLEEKYAKKEQAMIAVFKAEVAKKSMRGKRRQREAELENIEADGERMHKTAKSAPFRNGFSSDAASSFAPFPTTATSSIPATATAIDNIYYPFTNFPGPPLRQSSQPAQLAGAARAHQYLAPGEQKPTLNTRGNQWEMGMNFGTEAWREAVMSKSHAGAPCAAPGAPGTGMRGRWVSGAGNPEDERTGTGIYAGVLPPAYDSLPSPPPPPPSSILSPPPPPAVPTMEPEMDSLRCSCLVCDPKIIETLEKMYLVQWWGASYLMHKLDRLGYTVEEAGWIMKNPAMVRASLGNTLPVPVPYPADDGSCQFRCPVTREFMLGLPGMGPVR